MHTTEFLISPIVIADYMLIAFIIGLVGGWLIGYNTQNNKKL